MPQEPEVLPDDNELISRLLQKDEKIYAQVVKTYYRPMLNIAQAIVGQAFADEVVQDAWLAVVRALPKFERRSSLKTWILRITINMAKSRLRRESRSVAAGDLLSDEQQTGVAAERFDTKGYWRPGSTPHTWHHDTPESILASDELHHRLDNALANLPGLQQAAVVLRDMEGLSIAEICKILDISESNARVLLHRGRNKLRSVIEEYENS